MAGYGTGGTAAPAPGIGTGGTAAPAIPSHGTPHGAVPRPMRAAAEKRFLNRGNGRMETRKQMAATRAAHEAAAHHSVPAGHVVSKTTHSTTRTTTSGGGQLPSWINMNPSQLRQFAANLVAKETAAGRVPFQERGKAIGTEEGQAKASYAAAAQHGAEGQQQFVNATEASAKNYRNHAADVLAQAEAPTPGPAGPTTQVQQEQEARGAAARKALGLIGSNQANSQTAAEEAFAREVQQGQQLGSQAASNTMIQAFAKQRAENAGGERALVAKGPAETQQAYQNLLGEQAKIRTAREANNLKVATLTKDENVSRRSTGTARANAAESNQTRLTIAQQAHADRVRGQDLTHASAEARTAATREHTAVYAQIRRETANGTKPNPTAGRKYMTLVDNAVGYIGSLLREKRAAPAKAGENGAQRERRIEQEIRTALSPGAENATGKGGEPGIGYAPDVVSAAMNVARYGRLGPHDRITAKSYGLEPKMRPEWYKEAPGYSHGKKIPSGLNGIKGKVGPTH